MTDSTDKTIRESVSEERRVQLIEKSLDTLEAALMAEKETGEDWTAHVRAASTLLDRLEFKPPQRIELSTGYEGLRLSIDMPDEEEQDACEQPS